MADGYEDPTEEEEMRRLMRLALRMGYREGPRGDDDTKKWVVGVGVILAASFIIGGWVLSNQVAGLSATVNEWKRSTDQRLERLERQNERR